jgi:hypothetical protein
LEKGSIIESGKHEDLLEKQGLYYALWREQSAQGDDGKTVKDVIRTGV